MSCALALLLAGAAWSAPVAVARGSKPAPRPAPPPHVATVQSAGGRVVFVDEPNVVSMWADGTHRQQTDMGGGYVSDLTVSHDGRRAAYTYQPPGLLDPNILQIWTVPIDMSSPPRQLAVEAAKMLYEPTWSPDGRRLAYVAGYPVGYFGLGYQAQLWVMDSDGTHRHVVAVTPGAIEQPEWSPNGDRVAFVVDGQETSATLMVVAVNTVVPIPKAITPLGMTGVSKPHWSPSGGRLAFQTGDALYTVRPDGSELLRLAAGNNYPWNGGAVWSPDGRWLAFCDSSAGYFFGGVSGYGPTIVSADGTQQRFLGTQACLWPSWSPDGRAVAVIRAGSTGGGRVAVLPVDGSDPRELGPAGGWLSWHQN